MSQKLLNYAKIMVKGLNISKTPWDIKGIKFRKLDSNETISSVFKPKWDEIQE